MGNLCCFNVFIYVQCSISRKIQKRGICAVVVGKMAIWKSKKQVVSEMK
jgi:hypothetical protein